MKTFVLDTHTLVWFLSAPKRLGKGARRHLSAVDRGAGRALIAAITLVELTLLREAGRRVIGLLEVEVALAANPNLQILTLDLPQSKEFALLQSLEDPFDRLVVAAARATNFPLLTADERITASGLVQVIWD